MKKLRKFDLGAHRRDIDKISPLLRSMPWRNVRAGHARLPDIEEFLKYYEMYARLLAAYEEHLQAAMDSGRYRSFDLAASAPMVVIEGVDEDGNRETILMAVRKEPFAFVPYNHTPW